MNDNAQATQGGAGGPGSVRARILEELKRYAVVVAYLWVCLAVIFAYKSAILSSEGGTVLPMGTALIKALVLGKFLLIGEAAGVGGRAGPSTVLGRIAWKSVAFLVLLIVLTLVEELLVGMIHGKSAAQVLAELGSQPLEVLASSVLMFLILVPFFAFQEISRALGPRALHQVLTGSPDKPPGT